MVVYPLNLILILFFLIKMTPNTLELFKKNQSYYNRLKKSPYRAYLCPRILESSPRY